MTETMLTRAQYASEVGASVKSVERWLKAGLLPAAVRQGGRWYIPSGTPRPELDPAASATSRDVASVVPPAGWGELVSFDPVPAAPDRLGELVSLEEAARRLGTTAAVVRRLGKVGKLDVGRYGERGGLAVWVPPTR